MAVAVWAQPERAVITRMIRQLQVFPQEKTYVHTDGTDYSCGDRIWMKVYVVNALSHEPTDESRYVYVELISPDGRLVSRVKLISRDGVYAGYIDLPSDGEAGRYTLRSYTRLMTNVPAYESVKPIYVGGRQRSAAETAADEPVTDVQGDDRLCFVRTENRVKITTTEADNKCYLVAHCRAYPFFIGRISARQPVILQQDSLPQGVISLLLLDERLNILAERLFFSDNGRERCRLDITTDETTRAAGDSLVVRLSLPSLHAGERADLSVSVRAVGTGMRHQPSSILAHLFLATDVAGGLADAERMYGQSAAAIDTLLCGKQWARYDMRRMLSGQIVYPETPRETSNEISGRVHTLVRKRAVAGATVQFISPQAGVFSSVRTDSLGRFSFADMDFPEHTQYVLCALTDKGSDKVELTMDECAFPHYDLPVRSATDETAEWLPSDTLTGRNPDAILLDDVEVTAKRRSSASRGDAVAQLADFSFGMKQIMEMDATCLHEVLRRVPGVFIKENMCYVRAATSIDDDRPAAIAIDGVFVSSDYDLDNIQMADVARVDVFKTGSTVIWGAAGGSGVISVTTKLGNYGVTDTEQLNRKKISPLGYQRKADFSQYSGTRKTAYWNPALACDKFKIDVSRAFGRYIIVIEGVTTEGRLIHEEKEVELQ